MTSAGRQAAVVKVDFRRLITNTQVSVIFKDTAFYFPGKQQKHICFFFYYAQSRCSEETVPKKNHIIYGRPFFHKSTQWPRGRASALKMVGPVFESSYTKMGPSASLLNT